MTYVGRASELSRLLGMLGHVPVAVVSGLPGIGKTEFSYRLEAELTAVRPMKVTHVTCGPTLQGHLYEHLLERLTGDPGDNQLEPVVALLEQEPRLLVLEDAHFVAAEASTLIDRVMRRLSIAGRLLATTRVMLPLETTPAVVRLNPLSADDSRAMIEHLATRLGVKIDDMTALVARGMGSPLLLRELVAGHGIGDRVSAALRASLDALDASARHALLQLAAVAICSQSRGATEHLSLLETDLQTLDMHGFIERGPERLVVHDLVREAVLGHADDAVVYASRRRVADALWHQHLITKRAPAALEAICLIALAGELQVAMTYLQEASRTITDAGFDHVVLPMLDQMAARGALDATLLATRILMRTGRLREAAQKLSLLGPAANSDRRVVVLHAALAERHGDLESARRGYEEALAAAAPGATCRWLRLRLAVLHALTGQGAQADLALDAIETELRTCEAARDLPRYWWARGLSRMARYDWNTGFAMFREGLRAATEVGDRELAFLLRLAGLLATYELGDLDQAREWAAELADVQHEHLHNQLLELLRGAMRLVHGDLDAAIKHLRNAHEVHERERDVLLSALAAHYLARAMLAKGTPLAGSEVQRSVVNTAMRHGMGALVAPTKVALARALLAAGKLGEAQAIGTELLDSPVSAILGEAHSLLANIAALRGDVIEARRRLACGMSAVEERDSARARLMIDQATLELMGGDPERARAAALAVADTEMHRVNPQLRGRVLYVLAVADLAAGLVDTALEALAEAERLAAAYGLGQLAEELKLLRGITALGDAILNRIPAEHRPGFAGLMRVLGLRAGTLVVSSRFGRIYADPGQLPLVAQHFDLVIDRVSSSLRSRAQAAEGRATAVAILAGLAESHEEVSPERLYQIVWGGSEYHPLRHRNTLYIALNRTRKLLKDLGEDREVIRRGPLGWSISPDIILAIVRRDPRVSTAAAAL